MTQFPYSKTSKTEKTAWTFGLTNYLGFTMDQINPPIDTNIPNPQPPIVLPPTPKPFLFLPIFLTFLVTSVLFIGGYFGYQYFILTKVSQPTVSGFLVSQTPSPTPSDWKTHPLSDDISIKYPSTWIGSTTVSSPNIDLDTNILSKERRNNESQNYIVSIQLDDPKNYATWSKYSTTKNLGTETINGITFNKYIVADMYYSLNYIYKTPNDQVFRLFVDPYEQENFPQQLSETITEILSTLKFSGVGKNETNSELTGFVKQIDKVNDQYQMIIDQAEWVPDSTVPNGYKISNPLKDSVRLTIDPKTIIIMQTYSYAPDGNFNFNQQITPEQFYQHIQGLTQQEPFFIVTLDPKSQVLTKITERYRP